MTVQGYSKNVHNDVAVFAPQFTLNRLVINKISVEVPGRPILLKDISLEVCKGEITAILGEKNSGKSTLLHILQKQYKPKHGKIDVNGTDFTSVDSRTWQEAVALVPQSVRLQAKTLLYNLAPTNKPEDIFNTIRFCEVYGFDHFFQRFPQSYLTDTTWGIAEDQLKLVALAQALLRKPQLLLLDETVSSGNQYINDFILHTLERVKKEMAIILVTHRVRPALNANRIYSMSKC